MVMLFLAEVNNDCNNNNYYSGYSGLSVRRREEGRMFRVEVQRTKSGNE